MAEAPAPTVATETAKPVFALPAQFASNNVKNNTEVFFSSGMTDIYHCYYEGCKFSAPLKRKIKAHQQKMGHLAVKPKPRQPLFGGVIIPSNAPLPGALGEEFRKYKFTEITARLAESGHDITACLDTGCGSSLIDEALLQDKYPRIHISKRKGALRVRGLGDNFHSTSRYVVTNIYIPCDKGVMKTTKEIRDVKGLGVPLLLGTDFILSEGASINYTTMLCGFPKANGIQAPITARAASDEEPMSHRMVHTRAPVMLQPGTDSWVPVKFKKFKGRDVEFVPVFSCKNCYLRTHGEFLRAMVNRSTKELIFRSHRTKGMTVPANTPIGYLREFDMDVKAYYIASADPRAMALNMLAADTELAREQDTTSIPSLTNHPGQPLTDTEKARVQALLAPLNVCPDQEREDKPYGVTINRADSIDEFQTAALSSVVRAFPELWTCENTVMNEPEADFLRIPLTDPSKEVKPRAPYRLSLKDKKVIDETFGKLHDAGKMSYAKPGAMAWLCFDVWTGGGDKPEKGRVVIDIRGLNALVPLDNYPMPHCENIMASVQGCNWLSTFDLTSSFHQRLVHPEDRW